MSKMTVDRQFFKDRAEVMADIAKTGYWPTTYVAGESPELPIHHHGYDLIGYVISGSTYLLDEDKQRVEIGAGDRLNIPKGAWHAEGQATDKVTYIVTIKEPVPFVQALMPLEPKGPMPDLGF
ncbi:MAG: cupin domain-containing protein [Pseudomonadales bacterium]